MKGFEFVDLTTNDTNVLASITGNGPRVGKYFINRSAAERLNWAVKNSVVIICDELGTMEVKSKELINSVTKLLDVQKKVIIVVRQKLQHPLTIKSRKKCRHLISLDLGNREKVNQILLAALSVE
jgi:nucleoside-triphosphatase